MKKTSQAPIKFSSLTESFKAFGFPPPQHPLITIINGFDRPVQFTPPREAHVLSFYKIVFRPNVGGMLRYGQTDFDYNEGGLFFGSPNQILAPNENTNMDIPCAQREISILVHPDFFLNYPLAVKIKKYQYFSYSVNEALHLSEKEKDIILSLFRNIEEELSSRIDEHSHDVVMAQLELLLNYAERFYKRQFITRKTVSNSLFQQFEAILDKYFDEKELLHDGIPAVQDLADKLSISSGYLSDMLRTLTGQNAQQHIHAKLIEQAKEKLSTTNLSVSEIAYALGFGYPQSFSKLFKTKTNQSPLEFRERFN